MQQSIMQWAIRHGVSLQALDELQKIFGMQGGDWPPPVVSGRTEAAVQSMVRLEAVKKGVRLFRNNVGVLTNDQGVPVRYGLANESKKVNEAVKSGDLIGWRSILILPEMAGRIIAQFISRECKPVGWRYTDTAREKAQLAWIQLVTAGGGDAAFCTGEGTLDGSVNNGYR